MEGVILRELKRDDFHKGFREILAESEGFVELDEEGFNKIFDSRFGEDSGFYQVVAEDEATGKVVGTGGVFIERKYIRGASSAGHIEDVLVLGEWRERGIESRIILDLIMVARDRGCYKIICMAKEERCRLFEENGFKKHGLRMTIEL